VSASPQAVIEALPYAGAILAQLKKQGRTLIAPTEESLHQGQREVSDSSSRFRVAACGRRWGKSRLGIVEAVRAALKGGRVWWISPSFPVASSAWRELRMLTRRIAGVVIREGEREIGFVSGGAVRVRSADAPDSLRGEGLDFVVMDEAAFMAESVWTEALRPALADRRGRALFLSTPRGKNWFWRAYQRGLDGSDPEWKSFTAPTSSNPFIPAGEVEAARSSVPERIFNQEFLATFSDDAGDVFRDVRLAATATRLDRALSTHDYVMGVDWGKSNDFTVLVVIDSGSCEMVAFDRFNQIDYTVQRGRLAALAGRFNPSRIIAESNSIGVPIIEQLMRDGLPVEPFVTTNASKAEIIDGLALAFEKRTIRILPEPTLLAELEAFEMERLPSGMLRYAAPEGMHDDCVIATALAAWGAQSGAVPEFAASIGDSVVYASHDEGHGPGDPLE
jgi:hypothetical protein